VSAPRSLVLAAAAGLLGACRAPADGPAAPSAPASDPAPSPAPAALPTAAAAGQPRFVLLGESTELFTGLDDSADHARALGPDEVGSPLGLTWLMRLIDVHGPWLEVETVEIPPGHAHCTTPLMGLAGYRLRLFARADDAISVTTREVTMEIPGGSRVTVGPGMPVSRMGPGAPRAQVHTRPALDLPIPGDAIGRGYADPRHYDRGVAVARLRLGSLQLSDGQRLPGYLGDVVYDRHDEGDQARVTLAHECVRYELQVPADAVEPPEFGMMGMLSGSEPDAPRYSIAADAPVYWSNGERAGVTRRVVTRFDDPARHEVGRVCFAHRIATSRHQPGEHDDRLLLCLDHVDVRRVEPRPPPRAP